MARFGLALAGALLLCGAPLPAVAGDAFPKDLEKALTLVENGKWAAGETALRALFTAHEGDPRVRAELGRIEDALKVCLFRKVTKPPKGKELFGDSTKSFDRASRRIWMKFRGTRGQEWSDVGDGFRLLDLRLEESFTITIDAEFVNAATGSVGAALVCYDPENDGGYVVRPGYRLKGYEPGSGVIEKFSPKGRENLSGCYPEYDCGASGQIVIKRQSTSFSVKVNGKTKMKAKDHEFKSGHLALTFKRVTAVDVKGRLDKHYCRQRLAKYHDVAYTEWLTKTYDRDAELPEWVRTAGTAAPVATALPGDAEQMSDSDRARAERLVSGLLGGGIVETMAAKVLAKGLSARTNLYVEGLIALNLGDYRQAGAKFDELSRHEPAFQPAQVFSTIVRFHLRDDVAAVKKELTARSAAGSDFGPVYTALAQIALYEHDVEAAYRAVTDASARGVGGAGFERVRRWVHRAKAGPEWSRRFDSESEHFHVFSDHSKKICYETAQLLEKTRRQYAKSFRPLEGKGEGFKSRVYVFSGHDGYMDYTADLDMIAPNTAGLYSPTLRELLLWVPPIRTNLLDTIRHEGAHQYLHHFLDGAPHWFNEGWAEVFGGGETRERGPKYLRNLKSVEELMTLPPREFMSDAAHNYRQSYDLVQFLRTTKEPLFAGKLDSYFNVLLAGASRDEAFELVFVKCKETLDLSFRKAMQGG